MFSYIGHSTVGILVDLWFLGKTLLLWIQNMDNPKSVRLSMLELHWVVQFFTWTNSFKHTNGLQVRRSSPSSRPLWETLYLLLGDRMWLLPAVLRLHVSSKVTGGSSGLQSPLARSNLSKGFLVLHIFCSSSSQALNCFLLGTARTPGSPKPWLLSSETVWQLKPTL